MYPELLLSPEEVVQPILVSLDSGTHFTQVLIGFTTQVFSKISFDLCLNNMYNNSKVVHNKFVCWGRGLGVYVPIST